MVAEKDEVLVRPCMLRASVAPVVTRSRFNAVPGAIGVHQCVSPPLTSASVGGGGAKQNIKLRGLEDSDRQQKWWEDALNGNFPDEVRLVNNRLVRNGRWCVPTPPVYHSVAENHDALYLTTSSDGKHWKEKKPGCGN